jgi:hypothetical protein
VTTETADYGTWTVEELRDELRARDLPANGNKSELVARLKDHDEEEATKATAVAPVPAADRAPEDRPPEHGPTQETKPATHAQAPRNAWPVSDCVVDDGTPHTGRAINGQVCSAHAMHYRSDGQRRQPTATGGDRAGATVRTDQ